jgi:DNA polymerase-1
VTGKKEHTDTPGQPDLFSRINPYKDTEPQKTTPVNHIRNIFAIDANSIIHRAFHALPLSLKNSKGQIVNAAYGFASMLVKIILDFKPDACVAAFDTRAPTFRHELFKEYKANRPETADELVQQFPLVKKVLEAFDIPVIEIAGFEADDILASVAEEAVKRNIEVYIVSGDRDMLQLVDDGIKVITTRKGVSEVKIYDEKAVFERFGVYPDEIPDYLALKGEASDNIPGIPGIGEKTASQLIRKFGSIEKIYENIEDLKEKKYYSALVEHRDQVFRARELATLRKDAPLDIEKIFRKFSFDTEKVARIFSELEFSSLLKRLSIPEKPIDLEISFTVSARKGSVPDVLLSGKKESRIFVGIDEASYVSSSDSYAAFTSIDEIADIFLSDISVATNNLKKLYLKVRSKELRKAIEEKVRKGQFDDLSILLWLNNPDKKKYELADYVGNDSWFEHLHEALRWSEALREKIAENGMDDVYLNVELPFALVLAEMEECGLPVDPEALEDLSKELESLIQAEAEEIYRLSGTVFNINSPQQLSKVLYEILKIRPSGRKRSHYSTDQSTLMNLVDQHPVIEHILSYRELVKLKRTYVDAFIEKLDRSTLRIYSNFIQTGTATGRITSEEPNLQNIPLKGSFSDEFRRAIKCEEGWIFIAADYANIDLRVLAHLSSDERLIEAFKAGKDIHTITAAEVLGVPADMVDERIRRIAKAINFGIIYGVTPEGLSRQAGISTEEAKAYIESYFEKYRGVRDYIERTVKEAYENGYVRTLLGRRRYLPGLRSSNIAERNASERLAMNTPVQGSSADIIKLAMIKFREALKNLKTDARLILQIHDSLLVEAREEEADEVAGALKNAMENAAILKVPLSVSVKTGKTLASL